MFADKVTTPLLILHGSADLRVPTFQGQEFYALRGEKAWWRPIPGSPNFPRLAEQPRCARRGQFLVGSLQSVTQLIRRFLTDTTAFSPGRFWPCLNSYAEPLRIRRQHISGNLSSIWHDQQTITRGQTRVLHNAILIGCRNRSTQTHVP